MSQVQTLDMIGRRSELLATVVRRLNIDVHIFGTNEGGPDLICTIRPDPDDKLQGFLPFGVFVWGTSKELANEHEAVRFARSQRRKIRNEPFVIPVIVLLFSMKKDEAYFAWLAEPCEDSAKLIYSRELDFAVFDTAQLDRVIAKIKTWYGRMQSTILAHSSKAESSGCSDG